VFCKINSFLKRKHTVCRTSEMTHVGGKICRTYVKIRNIPRILGKILKGKNTSEKEYVEG
jgi:hypothetical protein